MIIEIIISSSSSSSNSSSSSSSSSSSMREIAIVLSFLCILLGFIFPLQLYVPPFNFSPNCPSILLNYSIKLTTVNELRPSTALAHTINIIPITNNIHPIACSH